MMSCVGGIGFFGSAPLNAMGSTGEAPLALPMGPSQGSPDDLGPLPAPTHLLMALPSLMICLAATAEER